MEIEKTFKLLEEGDKRIQINTYKEAVLLLGNTGSGKSTLALFLTGGDLVSVKVNAVDHLIKDNNEKISVNSTITSQTIFPELFVNSKTNMAFYDCPGFIDTRSVSHDIATTYFIKKVTDSLEKVKLFFVVNYNSVKKGGDRNDFMRLVRQVTEFIKNIEKFKNSMYLITTKVDNPTAPDDYGNPQYLPDSDIIQSIASFLEETRTELVKKVGTEIGVQEKIKFIDLLLEKDGVDYLRIGIFRAPTMAGPLSRMPMLQAEKLHMEKVLLTKLDFTRKENSDFGYTISKEYQDDINKMLTKIGENMQVSISIVAKKIQEHYGGIAEEVNNKVKSLVLGSAIVDVNKLKADVIRFIKGYIATGILLEGAKKVTTPAELVRKINVSTIRSEINIEKSLSDISGQTRYLDFLKVVSGKDLGTASQVWATPFQSTVTNLENLGYRFRDTATNAIKTINEEIKSNLTIISQKMQKCFFINAAKSEIQQIPAELDKRCSSISALKTSIGKLPTPELLLQEVIHSTKQVCPNITDDDFRNIYVLEKYLNFAKVLAGAAVTSNRFAWLEWTDTNHKFFEELKDWYSFLLSIYNKFSEYSFQQNLSTYNVADLKNWGSGLGRDTGINITASNFEQFAEILKQYNIRPPNLQFTELDDLKIKQLNELIKLILSPKLKTILACESGTLEIKGDFIKFSDFIDSHGKINKCNSRVHSIRVFTLNTIFVDEDLNAIGEKLAMTIIAPKWEIIGARKIVLDGSDGKPYELSAEHERPGKPGVPGGSAGSFFGIGETFINSNLLVISANGGKGGRGQDGGNGRTGKKGRSYVDQFTQVFDCNGKCEKRIRINDWNSPCSKECKYLKNIDGFPCSVHNVEPPSYTFAVSGGILGYYSEFKINGTNGEAGGSGGKGGVGGHGGNFGNIELYSLGNHIEIIKNNNIGNTGRYGLGGNGGTGGRSGDTVDLYCKPTVDEDYAIEGIYPGVIISQSGARGIDNSYNEGIAFPEQAPVIQKQYLVNDYKGYLRESLNTLANKNIISRFINKLENSSNVKRLYNLGTSSLRKKRSAEQSQLYVEQMSNGDTSASTIPQLTSVLEKFKHFGSSILNSFFSSSPYPSLDFNNKTNGSVQVTRNSTDVNSNLLLGQLLIGKIFGENKTLHDNPYISPEQEKQIKLNELAQEVLPELEQDNFDDPNYNSDNQPQWYKNLMQEDEDIQSDN